MEAPRENIATAITANASMDMDQLVTDIVTKLVNPLNEVHPLQQCFPTSGPNRLLEIFRYQPGLISCNFLLSTYQRD